MRITDLGVISEAVVELGPGLSVLTGETGAGKTMVVSGLGLLLGGRADTGVVRSGADAARVEGRFVVAADGPVAARAADAGADLDDVGTTSAGGPARELIAARTVAASGRGRAHLGGRTVPVAVLAELADDLVAVHGQSEQVLLRSPARQREIVDRFGGAALAEELAGYEQAWAGFAQVDAELAEITTRARERRQEAELLRTGLAEVERVDPRPGEDDELRALTQRLEHAEELRTASADAHRALAGDVDEVSAGGDPDVVTLVEQARRALEAVADHDGQLGALATRAGEIGYLAADLAADLASYVQGVEVDPARLAQVHDRRAELAGLTRRFGDDVAAVLEWAQQASRRLLELDGDDDRVEELTARHRELDADLDARAARLRGLRRSAGDRLASAVQGELAALAMPSARLEVQVTERARGPHGADEVALLLAAHSGAEPRPLARGASGGELSRVMLALEVALAGSDPVPTFVFDEVDAGVGGAAAVEIGRRLAALARTAQVVVVTHLPQVAAFADTHLVVRKADDGQVTESGVHRVEGEDRVRELARMLAGQQESASAREHAAELLEQARRG
jgi:DNA repair protein RecN (Recombination protein N)